MIQLGWVAANAATHPSALHDSEARSCCENLRPREVLIAGPTNMGLKTRIVEPRRLQNYDFHILEALPKIGANVDVDATTSTATIERDVHHPTFTNDFGIIRSHVDNGFANFYVAWNSGVQVSPLSIDGYFLTTLAVFLCFLLFFGFFFASRLLRSLLFDI